MVEYRKLYRLSGVYRNEFNESLFYDVKFYRNFEGVRKKKKRRNANVSIPGPFVTVMTGDCFWMDGGGEGGERSLNSRDYSIIRSRVRNGNVKVRSDTLGSMAITAVSVVGRRRADGARVLSFTRNYRTLTE